MLGLTRLTFADVSLLIQFSFSLILYKMKLDGFLDKLNIKTSNSAFNYVESQYISCKSCLKQTGLNEDLKIDTSFLRTRFWAKRDLAGSRDSVTLALCLNL